MECLVVHPWELTWEQALEIGEVVQLATGGSPFARWVNGGVENTLRYDFRGTRYYEWQQTMDTSTRLNLWVDNAECYRRLVRSSARQVIAQVNRSGAVCYVVRSRRTRQCVGYCVWNYPRWLSWPVDKHLGRHGLLWWVYKAWAAVVNSVGEWWEYLLMEHPLRNPRFKLWTRMCEREQVYHYGHSREMSPQELEHLTFDDQMGPKTHWQRSHCAELEQLVVEPHARGKGVARTLIEHSMAQLPRPTKAVVTSFDSMVGFYTKFGFRPYASFAPVPDDLAWTRHRMDMSLI